MTQAQFPRLVVARLLRTPQPHLDESLNGFLLRVTAANGFDEMYRLLDQAGVSPTVATTPNDLTALSSLLNVQTDALQRMAYWPMANRPKAYRSFRGTELRNYHAQLDPCRVCPECLRDAPYCRAAWDIRFACACPRHRVLLLDRCQGCQKPISWRRRSVTQCESCQADFRAFRSAAAEDSAIALCRSIYKAVGIEHGVTVSPVDLPAFVDFLPALQLLDFIKFLGSYGLDPHGELERLRLPRRKPEHLHQMLIAAADALRNWPTGFHELLDRVRTKNLGQITRTGLSGQFGDFYITLMRKFSSGHLSDVKEAFLSYIGQDGGHAFATKRGFKFEFSGDRDFMTRPEVAEFLGIASQTVDVLHQEGEIQGNTHPMGMTRTHGVFDRQSVEAYRDRRRHVIESRAAAARLGLSTSTFRQLIDGGLLEPLTRVSYRPRKAYEIDERGIDELLERLDKAATEFSLDAGTTYGNATLRLGSIGLSGIDLLKSVFAGATRIMIAKRTAAGLRRYMFSIADIDSLINDFSAKQPSRPVLVEAADELQIEPRYVARLVNQGVLRSRPGKAGTRTISRSELERFKWRYVSIRELARRQGRPAQQVLDLFCGSGGLPLLGRSLGVSNTFVERQQASKIFGDQNAA